MENCWEYVGCPESTRDKCAAYTEDSGAHCWLVVGTLCGDKEPHGYLIDKLGDCEQCLWYQKKVHGQILE